MTLRSIVRRRAVPEPAVTEGADLGEAIAARVREAASARAPVSIVGGGSKTDLGRLTQAPALEVGEHQGIIDYEPTELVVSARAGTPLEVLEDALAAERQMLAFEPPHLGPGATLGGTVAAGLSGPRRPFAGAVRDFVLGAKIVNGRGERLEFGGQVMKNVAGYDLSRLMCGAMGTLGVLLEISLKVLPQPAETATRTFELSEADALRRMNEWAGQPLPLSGAAHDGERLWVRLAGTRNGLASALAGLGGDTPSEDGFWKALREQRLAFFDGGTTLWRVSVAPATAPLELGPTLLDWGGAQRWVRTDLDAASLRERVAQAGGHATAFRNGDRLGDVYHPLAPGLRRLHDRLKRAFDPDRVLNPGRLYEGI